MGHRSTIEVGYEGDYLTDHRINAFNDENIHVIRMDVPDDANGNACHKYSVLIRKPDDEGFEATDIDFQHGPIKEVGPNGISQEALLAIVLDRLRAFQSSKFRCRENACAITKIEEALMWLHKRTLDRERRGVEGTWKE